MSERVSARAAGGKDRLTTLEVESPEVVGPTMDVLMDSVVVVVCLKRVRSTKPI